MIIYSTIRPSSDSINIPVVLSNEIFGGYHSVENLSSRNLIPLERRDFGMLSYVRSINKWYVLRNIVDSDKSNNDNWKEVKLDYLSETWIESVESVVDSLPTSPDIGDRYLFINGINTLYHNKIIEWNGTWLITSPKESSTLKEKDNPDKVWTFINGTWIFNQFKDPILFKDIINVGESINIDSDSQYILFGGLSNSGTMSISGSLILVNGDISGNSPIIDGGTITYYNFIEDISVGGGLTISGSNFNKEIALDLITGTGLSFSNSGGTLELFSTFVDTRYPKNTIEFGEKVEVLDGELYFIWGDLKVDGELLVGTGSKVVILNGALDIGMTGTVSNPGTIEIRTISSGETGSVDYISGITLSGNDLVFSGTGSAFSGTISLPVDYISGITLSGNDLIFTGTGSAFNDNVDLSPLKDKIISISYSNFIESLITESLTYSKYKIEDYRTIYYLPDYELISGTWGSTTLYPMGNIQLKEPLQKIECDIEPLIVEYFNNSLSNIAHSTVREEDTIYIESFNNYYGITNSIINPTFSDGLDNWTYSGTFTFSSNGIELESGPSGSISQGVFTTPGNWRFSFETEISGVGDIIVLDLGGQTLSLTSTTQSIYFIKNPQNQNLRIDFYGGDRPGVKNLFLQKADTRLEIIRRVDNVSKVDISFDWRNIEFKRYDHTDLGTDFDWWFDTPDIHTYSLFKSVPEMTIDFRYDSTNLLAYFDIYGSLLSDLKPLPNFVVKDFIANSYDFLIVDSTLNSLILSNDSIFIGSLIGDIDNINNIISNGGYLFNNDDPYNESYKPNYINRLKNLSNIDFSRIYSDVDIRNISSNGNEIKNLDISGTASLDFSDNFIKCDIDGVINYGTVSYDQGFNLTQSAYPELFQNISVDILKSEGNSIWYNWFSGTTPSFSWKKIF